MESINELRELMKEWRSKSVTPGRNPAADKVDCIADAIEAEIAEKYMELPLDADGVSIKVGDMIQFVNEYGGTGSKVEVCAVSNYYAYYGEGKHFYNVKYCRHVSRTLEDVLEDFIKTYDRWDEKGIDEDERTALFSEYATEIRDLLGVSDDSR